MVLDEKTRELIAVGASITAHCEPCLAHHVKKASAAGACEKSIAEAVEVGKAVRTGANAAMDRYAARWHEQGAPAGGCGCGAPSQEASGGRCA